MKVIWSPLAVERVLEAAQYIALDKPEVAEKWAQTIFGVVKRLEKFARSGRIVPELGREDIRELQHGSYRIIYKVERKGIVVLTVRHARRRLDRGEIERQE
ncbi:type II toxin-antitoxin system RelE/ParE family toxin [Acidobacteria bacterium AH-259-L09]|nr:type II toxin-antitoxin system RelE/ParE family toxin [Acidobacteria bacterium AH-259-L09]